MFSTTGGKSTLPPFNFPGYFTKQESVGCICMVLFPGSLFFSLRRSLSFSRLTYSVPGSLCLPLPFTHLTQSPLPHQFCSLYHRSASAFCLCIRFFLLLFSISLTSGIPRSLFHQACPYRLRITVTL